MHIRSSDFCSFQSWRTSVLFYSVTTRSLSPSYLFKASSPSWQMIHFRSPLAQGLIFPPVPSPCISSSPKRPGSHGNVLVTLYFLSQEGLQFTALTKGASKKQGRQWLAAFPDSAPPLSAFLRMTQDKAHTPFTVLSFKVTLHSNRNHTGIDTSSRFPLRKSGCLQTDVQTHQLIIWSILIITQGDWKMNSPKRLAPPMSTMF